MRSGLLRRSLPHHLSLIPGRAVAGVVRAVGPAVADFAVGDAEDVVLDFVGGAALLDEMAAASQARRQLLPL